MRCVAGLDLAAGRGVTALALLTLDERGAMRYAAEKSRPLTTDEEILQALADAHPTVLAIDAPLSLPRAVQAAIGQRPAGDHSPGDSPYTRRAERDPIWSTLGVRPFPVSFLGGLTFRAIVLASVIRVSLQETAVIETFPTAVFRGLGCTVSPVPGERRPRKSTQAAREALQRKLATMVHGVPNPSDLLLDVDGLDAIGAALAAVAFKRGEYLAVGEALEGQVILPLPSFRLAPVTSN